MGCHEWMGLGPWSVSMMACYLDFLVGGEYNDSDKKQKIMIIIIITIGQAGGKQRTESFVVR